MRSKQKPRTTIEHYVRSTGAVWGCINENEVRVPSDPMKYPHGVNPPPSRPPTLKFPSLTSGPVSPMRISFSLTPHFAGLNLFYLYIIRIGILSLALLSISKGSWQPNNILYSTDLCPLYLIIVFMCVNHYQGINCTSLYVGVHVSGPLIEGTVSISSRD